MNMIMKRELFEPQEIKEMYPISEKGAECKKANDQALREVLGGKSDKFILIIGPCSADHEDSVIEYIKRLRPVQDKVADKLVIIPRVYTNKPRTTGAGYKGMLHQPNPITDPDILKRLIATRPLHMTAIN